jgi:putative hydrolases of HD superfamily
MNIDRDLQLLYELGTLRNIPRVWRQMVGPGVANLAEHHFRVAWIALMLSKMENAGSHEKILKMALVHDVSESRAGDVHYISRLYTKRDEHSAISETLKDTSLDSEMKSTWEEYEERECIEAKIVKDADNLDVDLELRELCLDTDFEKRWHKIRKESVYPKLFTESAKKLWLVIENSSPHDWHIFAKNRHNAGDWKVEADDSSNPKS